MQRGVQLARDNQPGPNRSVQAVLDLVSRDRDPLLVYSDNQFVYPDYRRVPASRFQQRYFLIGSIYLGETSPKFVLPHTWTWFRQDMRKTNPAAYFQIATESVDSKEFADYLVEALREGVHGRGRHGRAPQRRRRVRPARIRRQAVDRADRTRTRLRLARRRELRQLREGAVRARR